MAGITVAILLVPQAMAYAILAGVPAVYGIYASIVPLLIYGLLSSTPHVSVGPTALASILTAAALSGVVATNDPAYLNYCFLLAGLTGLVQLSLGVLRLGSIINFLSRPVISGFISAAAVLILTSQIKALLGLTVVKSEYFHESLLRLFKAVWRPDWLTALFGLVTLFTIPILKKWLKGWPILLLFITGATLLSWLFKLPEQGLEVLGEVPNGLPAFGLPEFSGKELLLLLPSALVLGLVSFIETLSIGKTFQERYEYYRAQPNRELIALGSSKLLGSLFQAIPTSASFSRSAVSEQSGTHTVVSSLTTVLLLALCALFLMEFFYFLPLTVLAAIIILSVRKLFDYAEMRRLWKLEKKDFATLLVTFLVTLFGGLQFGIIAGVLLSLTFMLLKSTKPHLAELGRLPDSNAFRNIDRFPQAEVEADVLIIRFDAELFFGNADFFRERLTQLIRAKGDDLALLIIDAHTIHNLDTSGAFALNGVIDFLEKRGGELYLAGAIGPVRDQLYRFGIMDRIGSNNQFLSIQSALDHYQKVSTAEDDWERPAVQHE
ncbi:sodium-independent anion transporter [Lewinellaceae bacterium SD302]|nr:sodium-independent anion transporter [Lewinellaceae bacterium SD302]